MRALKQKLQQRPNTHLGETDDDYRPSMLGPLYLCQFCGSGGLPPSSTCERCLDVGGKDAPFAVDGGEVIRLSWNDF